MDVDTINEHYSKYGNTNLITNSGLKDKQIHAIGDSHTIFFHNSMKIYEHWGYKVSMYDFTNSNVDLYKLGNILGNGHEKYNIKMNDYVLLYHGYNDVQKHFFIHYRYDIEKQAKKLIDQYIEKVLYCQIKYSITPIISCIYPVSINKKSLDVRGSDVERIKYTLIMNQLLEARCKENSILFLNIYYDISKNNRLDAKYTVDGTHLDYNNEELRQYIETKIYELIL